jgi:EKC/KEOPS complex subunit CGI121/TPRKB
MAVQTLHLPHTPPNLAIHVALYKDVQNAASLKQRLLAGDAQFEYAFIDASMVRHPSPDGGELRAN